MIVWRDAGGRDCRQFSQLARGERLGRVGDLVDCFKLDRSEPSESAFGTVAVGVISFQVTNANRNCAVVDHRCLTGTLRCSSAKNAFFTTPPRVRLSAPSLLINDCLGTD